MATPPVKNKLMLMKNQEEYKNRENTTHFCFIFYHAHIYIEYIVSSHFQYLLYNLYKTSVWSFLNHKITIYQKINQDFNFSTVNINTFFGFYLYVLLFINSHSHIFLFHFFKFLSFFLI